MLMCKNVPLTRQRVTNIKLRWCFLRVLVNFKIFGLFYCLFYFWFGDVIIDDVFLVVVLVVVAATTTAVFFIRQFD